MSQATEDLKRQISMPPHHVGFFNAGEFIYEPDAAWEDLQTGMIVNRGEKWLFTMAPKTVDDSPIQAPLESHPRPIGRHILIDHSGLGAPRGPALDPAPWRAIADKIRILLRDAEGN
jgi:hypothetical protein